MKKQIRSDKKRKAPCHKAFRIRPAPLFDKTVRKAGLIHFGAGDRTRTGTLSPAVDFESTTSTNSITPAGAGVIIHEIRSFGKSSAVKFLACTRLGLRTEKNPVDAAASTGKTRFQIQLRRLPRNRSRYKNRFRKSRYS